MSSPNPNLRPPGCRPYDPCNKDRVCAFTLVKEKDLPKGQKLFACGKCLETFYIDRESQKNSWRESHKYVCCPLAKDDRRVREGFESIEECFDAIDECMNYYKLYRRLPKGRLLLHALKELGNYASSGLSLNSKEGHLFKIGMTRFAHWLDEITKMKQYGDFFYNLLWAMPGSASYLLSDEIFLTPELKKDKMNGAPPPPKSLLKNGGFRKVSSPRRAFALYCLTIGNIYLLSFYPIRGYKAACQTAIARNVFNCWTCPFSRSSLPPDCFLSTSCSAEDYGVSRANVFSGGYIYLFGMDAVAEKDGQPHCKKWVREGEVVPGLSLKAMISATMEDECFYLVPKYQVESAYEVISALMAKVKDDVEFRKHLSIQDRWDLLQVWYTWDVPFLYRIEANGAGLRGLYRHLILSDRAEIVFKLYSLAKDSVATSDVKTAQDEDELQQQQQQFLVSLVEYHRLRALKSSKPLAALYGELMHGRYQNSMLSLGMAALPFPEDAEDLIAEFAADEIVDVA